MNKEIFISSECYIQDVCFLDDKHIVVGTAVGHFAVLQFAEDRSFRAAVLFHTISPPHPVLWASCCSKGGVKKVFVCFTESAVSVAELQPDAVRKNDFVDIPDRGQVASTCLLDTGKEDSILIVDTMLDSRSLRLQSLSTADGGIVLLSKVTLSDLPLDEASMFQDAPETYACNAGDRYILVTLYGDCFVFCSTTYSSAAGATTVAATASNKNVLISSVLRNDLALPFSSGCWQKTDCTEENTCTFYVFRADCTCFAYSVRLDTLSRSIVEITMDKQVHLQFYLGTFIHGAEIILVVKNCDALLNGMENSVQATRIPGDPFMPEFVGDVERRSTILHLESVNVRGRNHFLCVCNSGECFILPYDNQEKTEKELLATEESPYEITSCLAVDKDGKVECILGYFDGKIKVFTDQRLCVLLRMVHCGAVDKLLSVSHIDKMYDVFFVSVCSEVGTLCFHRNEDIKVSRIVASPSGPLTAVFLDNRGEYLYVFSNQICNIWHLSTCRLERTIFCPSGQIPNFEAENILSTRRSSLTIIKTSFAGDAYYSIKVDVDKLIHELMTKNFASDDFKDSLFLLCQLDSITDLHSSLQGTCLRTALTSLSLGVTSKPNHLMLLTAMALVSAFVECTADGISANAALKLWSKLIENLAEMDHLEKTICSYFFIFFVDATSITALARSGLVRLIAKSNASQMMHTLLAVDGSGDRVAAAAGQEASSIVRSLTTCAGQKLMTQSAVALSLIIAGAAPVSIWERPQSEISMLEEAFNRSVDVIIDELKTKSLCKWNRALLVGLVECEKLHNQCDKWETLISMLLKNTLDEREKDVKSQCNAALEHFAAANFSKFLDKYFKPYYLHEHAMPPQPDHIPGTLRT
ncbi:hypothetical protein STCU_08138 [Strigomonas culicis]|uniref:DUF7048 domain-containing protein n=1 Tax=Strigomonas culicis TaxID=28005 RepID=S9TWB8_9TRYP|nr:hypothetical protein STCU_08138 [Strigomonas culicis]|eukprot:EPY22772.1 hypothetical protein STCU_08138 [Strigomonas culicis]